MHEAACPPQTVQQPGRELTRCVLYLCRKAVGHECEQSHVVAVSRVTIAYDVHSDAQSQPRAVRFQQR